ncbi:DUF3298 and DUF4163 domain-containing protein [Antarcticibacterium flavum]|uniref:DUF3298 and DUF4163 domain-containing protein n=1 Tax=Antarcticibacterium flavum TaxID=2058175 RepID=A0A5B7X479_9FLAO|nr:MULTISPECIES: DUF3298 and DUF4163 domain-containing protein [Antarcticibacterium]MCM4159107.1 hypothetical protein [Antarcticibacterium sp. W02-3]QCY69508.1 DUF3298 and DUF4163 domain-containing protein [Antarcticibacterium flavum]
MKNAVKKLLCTLFIITLLTGCGKETPPPVFEEFHIDEVSSVDCDPEEENCAFISIHIPWAKNDNDRNRNINRHIEQHVINLIDFQEENDFGSLEALSQNFIDNYEASAKEFPEYNIPWEASVAGRILTNSPELISMEFKLAIFTGGAHGFTSTSYLNFNPETGETYETSELFTSEFNEYAERLFREKNDIPQDQPINSTGYFFEGDSFSLPQNIGFYRNRIILRYNAYEVASYSEGGIQLEIPKEQAEEYLKIL